VGGGKKKRTNQTSFVIVEIKSTRWGGEVFTSLQGLRSEMGGVLSWGGGGCGIGVLAVSVRRKKNYTGPSRRETGRCNYRRLGGTGL